MTVYLIYRFNKLIRKLRQDEAAIIICRNSIKLNGDGSPKTFNWKEIQDISITNDDGTQYLLLQTIHEEKIGITWLDKSPPQMKNLTEEY